MACLCAAYLLSLQTMLPGSTWADDYLTKGPDLFGKLNEIPIMKEFRGLTYDTSSIKERMNKR
jgi:hypothetical protein